MYCWFICYYSGTHIYTKGVFVRRPFLASNFMRCERMVGSPTHSPLYAHGDYRRLSKSHAIMGNEMRHTLQHPGDNRGRNRTLHREETPGPSCWLWLSSQRTSRRPRLVLGAVALGVVVLGISNTSCRPYYCFLLHVTVYRTARELGKPLRFFSRSCTVARYPTYYTHGSSPTHAQSLVFNRL